MFTSFRGWSLRSYAQPKRWLSWQAVANEASSAISKTVPKLTVPKLVPKPVPKQLSLIVKANSCSIVTNANPANPGRTDYQPLDAAFTASPLAGYPCVPPAKAMRLDPH